MKKFITIFMAISIAGFINPSIAQMKYNPYGTDATIYLTEPGPSPRPTPGGVEAEPYQSNGSMGVNAAADGCECVSAEDYYKERNNTKGYQGVASASRAGEVASISVCEMIAAAALVGAIAVIALVFNTGHAH
jgi:hypothetical protein